MNQRQQSTTDYPIPIMMISSSNHISGVTGLSPSAWLSKSGSAFVSASGAISEAGSGLYWLAGHANDRSALGSLAIHVAASAGADPFDIIYTIVPWNPFDAVRMGLTSLPNVTALTDGGLSSASGIWLYSARTVTGGSVVATSGSVTLSASSISACAIGDTGGSMIADHVLTRDWTGIVGEAARSTLNALRFIRNKWSISGTTLTVTKEDDSSSAWTATISSSANADSVIAVDPS